MSYILEALKKSELQRQQGRVPDLNALPANVGAGGIGAPHSPWPVIVGGVVALVLSAAAMLVWWQPWRATPKPAAALAPVTEPAQVAPAAAAKAGAEGALGAAAGEQLAAATGPRVDRPAPAQPAAPAPSAAAVGDGAPRVPAPTAASPRPEAAVPKPALAVTSKAPAPVRPAPAGPSAAQAPAGDTPMAPPTASTVADEAPTAPPSGRVLNYSELPSAVRRSIPALSVSGYSYAEDSGLRTVVINDRMLGEGDDAGSGVSVERIGTEGVILNFKGYRFRPAP